MFIIIIHEQSLDVITGELIQVRVSENNNEDLY
jgi:hypothetical protein